MKKFVADFYQTDEYGEEVYVRISDLISYLDEVLQPREEPYDLDILGCEICDAAEDCINHCEHVSRRKIGRKYVNIAMGDSLDPVLEKYCKTHNIKYTK